MGRVTAVNREARHQGAPGLTKVLKSPTGPGAPGYTTQFSWSVGWLVSVAQFHQKCGWVLSILISLAQAKISLIQNRLVGSKSALVDA